MTFILHNLKVALRNLSKYKLQTFIYVLSIAIGIVTLAFAHAAVSSIKLPNLYFQPYYDRAYNIYFQPSQDAGSDADTLNFANDTFKGVSADMWAALRKDGGLSCTESMAMPNGTMFANLLEFHLCDSSVVKSDVKYTPIDPGFLTYVGLRSAITGEKIKRLNKGEAIISKELAREVFGTSNPIGAVQPVTYDVMPVPLTIVDVYEDLAEEEKPLDNRMMYYSVGEMDSAMQNAVPSYAWYAGWVAAVLKEGCSEQQLLSEVNSRVKPFGVAAKLDKVSKRGIVEQVIFVNALVHVVGSLILLAAIICYLRMQVQLFWNRRREIALRMINGAKRWQLFGLLLTEVTVTVCLSVAVAVVMGEWLENFICTSFGKLMSEIVLPVDNLSDYSLRTGLRLLAVCAAVVWTTLQRVCNSRQALAANMRSSRSHIFRNVMLTIQIAISLAFVCTTFFTAWFTGMMLKRFNIPEDKEWYDTCLFLDTEYAQDEKELMGEIQRLPDLEKVMRYRHIYLCLEDVENNPDMLKEMKGISYKPFFCNADTSLLDFYHIKVNWFRRHSNLQECVILNENLYRRLKELGLASNDVLTIRLWDIRSVTLPIAGTIQGVPFTADESSILIHPENSNSSRYVLIPKPGRHESLKRGVEAVAQRLQNTSSNLLSRFSDYFYELRLIESFATVGWILGTVSLILCAMSIYSSISLDTRGRRKEVAIRKVNGAKSRDIYSLFGRTYVIVTSIALVTTMPVLMLIGIVLNEQIPNQGYGDVPVIAMCAGGALTVILMVALIVGWHIHMTMRTNPAESIAKE